MEKVVRKISLIAYFFARLFVSEQKQIALIADEFEILIVSSQQVAQK